MGFVLLLVTSFIYRGPNRKFTLEAGPLIFLLDHRCLSDTAKTNETRIKSEFQMNAFYIVWATLTLKHMKIKWALYVISEMSDSKE